MKFDIKPKDLEGQLFLLALLIAIPYLGISIFFDLVSMSNSLLLTIDLTFFGICLVMLLLRKVASLRPILINFFCLLIIAGVYFYWVSSGGLNGGGAYVFPVVSILIILITRGIFRVVFSTMLVVLTVVLGFDMLPIIGEISYSGLLFDYFLNLVMLSVLLILFKMALDKERNQIEFRNAELEALNKTLIAKTEELEQNTRQIQQTHDNLRAIVQERTKALEEENSRIVDFAFINAHLVRAPLTNIMGLVDLISESHKEPRGFEKLKKHANQLDGVLHKIGGVLNQ
ncbi:MAG: hypothetical protein RLN88_14080 [Ekhidna sp.]|uniref:hypothetical protein n=1 Tax=Ekhidna sp. TaxID=2608089 RepID=UPI0032EFCBF0